MRRRALARMFVTLATLVVAWLVASPAQAALTRAPVCDPRGAIGFAPPPQMQDVESSLDVVAAEDDCASTDPLSARHVTRDRAPSFDFTALDSVAPQTLPVLPPDAGCEAHRAPAETRRAHPGFVSSIERPPRA